jgi:DNA invertase Pin-like site-specific DNA recombinase
MLTAIADFERELIRERTGEGRKRAMANAVKFSRKRKLYDYQRRGTQGTRQRRDTGSDHYGNSISMISRF